MSEHRKLMFKMHNFSEINAYERQVLFYGKIEKTVNGRITSTVWNIINSSFYGSKQVIIRNVMRRVVDNFERVYE